MGEVTSIAWTDATFNPWHGCTKVSPGCDFCYAETLNHRWGKDNWGKGKPRRLTSDSNWNEPLRWQKRAIADGRHMKVFCASMADVMDDEAPEGARERLWALIDKTPNLIWQLLTKRPQRYARYLPKDGFVHDNVWLGNERREPALLRHTLASVAKHNLRARAHIVHQLRARARSSFDGRLGFDGPQQRIRA